MSDFKLHALGAEELAAIGDELEQAITGHVVWLKSWHRALVCRLPFNGTDLREDAHCRCDFGQWYYRGAHRELIKHPDFEAIGRLHKQMHDEARRLGMAAQTGSLLSPEHYDAFINQQIEFSKKLTVLRNKITGYQYMVDPLLNIASRQAMYPVLRQEQERASRTGRPCVVALVDLDYFKRINDTYGHGAGDEVLKAVTAYLRQSLRVYDALFRYGGEEFLVCLPGTSVLEGIGVLDRVRAGVAEQVIAIGDGRTLQVTLSGGLAELDGASSIDKAIENADTALYQAKEQGRNRLVAFNGEV